MIDGIDDAVDLQITEGFAVALCRDGTVWKWNNTDVPRKILGNVRLPDDRSPRLPIWGPPPAPAMVDDEEAVLRTSAAAFAKALSPWDDAALRAHAIGTGAELSALRNTAAFNDAVISFNAASVKAFNDQGVSLPQVDWKAMFESANFKLDGDEAKVTDTLGNTDANAISFKRDQGRWKIRLASMALDPGFAPSGGRGAALTQVIEDVTTKIQAGAYHNASEVGTDLAARMNAAVPQSPEPKTPTPSQVPPPQVESTAPLKKDGELPPLPTRGTGGAAADNATPQRAVISFMAAVFSGDDDTMHAIGLGPEEDFRQLSNFGKLSRVPKAFTEALVKMFGPQTGLRNEAALSANWEASLAAATFQTVGGDSLVTDASQGISVRLKKRPTGWMVLVASFSEDPKTAAVLRAARSLVSAYMTVTQEVLAGKYKSSHEAQDAVDLLIARAIQN